MPHLEHMVPMEDGIRLHTYVFLPEGEGPFCAVVVRTPYAAPPSAEYCAALTQQYKPYTDQNFALVFQTCRGRGGSEGEFIPFEDERSDGLMTLNWIERQRWYGGGMYLLGDSYLNFVHMSYMAMAPSCVKGAALGVMCDNGNRSFFKNGVFKPDVSLAWFVNMYRSGELTGGDVPTTLAKAYGPYPFMDFSLRAYGRRVPEFDRYLNLEKDPLGTPGNYSQAFYAARNCRIPTLWKDGWTEMYLQGMTEMWHALPEETRRKSAFLLGPWSHNCRVEEEWVYPFPQGDLQVIPELEWFLHLRDGASMSLCQEGMVCYYAAGEGEWRCEPDLPRSRGTQTRWLTQNRALALQSDEPGEIGYTYDPLDPPYMPGGPDSFVRRPFGYAQQPPAGFRNDVISFLTGPLEKTMDLRGHVRAKLQVASDCEATMFVLRLSCVEENGSATVIQEHPAVVESKIPGQWQALEMEFDPLCWRLHPGQQLRLDVSSANAATYFIHPNMPGEWSYVASCRPAYNRIRTGVSCLELPADE